MGIFFSFLNSGFTKNTRKNKNHFKNKREKVHIEKSDTSISDFSEEILSGEDFRIYPLRSIQTTSSDALPSVPTLLNSAINQRKPPAVPPKDFDIQKLTKDRNRDSFNRVSIQDSCRSLTSSGHTEVTSYSAVILDDPENYSHILNYNRRLANGLPDTVSTQDGNSIVREPTQTSFGTFLQIRSSDLDSSGTLVDSDKFSKDDDDYNTMTRLVDLSTKNNSKQLDLSEIIALHTKLRIDKEDTFEIENTQSKEGIKDLPTFEFSKESPTIMISLIDSAFRLINTNFKLENIQSEDEEKQLSSDNFCFSEKVKDTNEIEVPKNALKEFINDANFMVNNFENPQSNPHNWSLTKKIGHTILYGITTLVAQYNSAVMAPVVNHVSEEFGTAFHVSVLCTCVYIIGIAFGPIIFAPMSEIYGRKISSLGPFFFGGMFTLAAACSYNIYSLIFFRFLAGVASAGPIVVGGGMLADIFDPSVRGSYLCIYSNFVTLGPCLSPIIGGMLLKITGWRSLIFFTAGLYLIVFIINLIFVSESYGPVLLSQEARFKRVNTKNWLYRSANELKIFNFHTFFHKHIRRPIWMMCTPIIFFVAGYASFVFGVFYLVATSVSFTFQKYRSWEAAQSGLPMLAVYLGASCIGIPINLLNGLRYKKLLIRQNATALPEERLHAVMFLGSVLPVGILVFGFTVSNMDFPWVVPCLGLGLLGAGFFIIFQGCLNYLVDAFPLYSASAIAVSTCLRSIVAGFLPFFAKEIFQGGGTEVGSLGISIVATACLPIPFLLYIKGEQMRTTYNFD